jgi:hypothetical protein
MTHPANVKANNENNDRAFSLFDFSTATKPFI